MGRKESMKKKALRQQEIVSSAKNELRELTPEETKEFEKLQGEIDNLAREIAVEEAGISENQTRDTAVIEERQRISSIMSMCRDFEMDPQSFINDNRSIDQVRETILENMRSERAPLSTRGSADLVVTADSEEKFRTAASDAILLRGGIELENPAPGARDLMGMTLRDLAIETMGSSQGGLNRKSNDELFEMACRQFFNPTAAFPTIMDQSIQKAYEEGHRTAAVTFDRWIRKGTLRDFKTHDNNYLAGPAGEFLEVPEGGELKHDIPSDVKRPTRKLKTFGRQFTMTRQAFINDDIGFLSTIPKKYATSARKTQNKQIYEILVKNAAIYDGVPLFSNAHKNLLASGTGITQKTMQIMIMALQSQLDEFGDAAIIRPATILVPVGYSFDMYVLFNSPTIHTTGNTQANNPLFRYKDQIQIIEEPTINVLCGGYGNQMPWFLLGDKNDTDFMEIDYLNGQEIPTIRRSEKAGTLGFIWDIYLDWGISVMDYRGAIMNPGIQIDSPLL